MDSDKLKTIPLEIVDTTARDEEAAVQNGTPTDHTATAEPSENADTAAPAASTDSTGAAETSDASESTEEPKKPAHKRRRKSSEEDVAEGMALKQVIADQAREDEREGSFNQSLKKVLVGELLNSRLVKDNIGLIVLVVVFVVVSITNRYIVQQSLLEQSRLKKELQDTKFRALSANSDLTERTRKSRILEALRSQQDSTLKDPPHPAFLIEVPAK